jgi:hypothetical protein
MFWGVVIAAIVAAFATGYPSWENYIVQEAAKRQLRAYIDVRPRGISTIEEGLVPRVHDSFHNIGQDPRVRQRVVFKNSGEGLPADAHGWSTTSVATSRRTRRRGSGSSERPSAPESRGKAPSRRRRSDAIKGGNSAIYFHGRVCYRDIFNEPHRTDFCLYWKWDAGRISPSLSCPQGNSAG